MLVLHGGPGLSVSIVDGLVADLLPAYRVATFQQRGIEPSTTEGAFTIDEAVADVGAVLDHLGWDRAYVVGSSWGGHLAFWVRRRSCPIGCSACSPSTRSAPSATAATPSSRPRWSGVHRRRTGSARPSWTGWRRRGRCRRSWRWRACGCSGRPTSPTRQPAPPMRSDAAVDPGVLRPVHRPARPAAGAGGVAAGDRACRSASSSATAARSRTQRGAGQCRPGARRHGPRWCPGPVTCPWYEVPGSVRQALDRLAGEVAHSSASSA